MTIQQLWDLCICYLAPGRKGDTAERLNPWRLACAMFLLCATIPVLATAQTYTDLYDFTNSFGPSGVAQGPDGNLYATTYFGGDLGCGLVGCGSIFKITPDGTLTNLYQWDDQLIGSFPEGGLTLGRDGNFYGTTNSGGPGQAGTIFRITSAGTRTTLYNFTYNGTDEYWPDEAPVQGVNIDFYGTTTVGGNERATIYRLSVPQASVASFVSFTALGQVPGNSASRFVLARDGRLYAMTGNGGAHGKGTVFSVTLAGRVKVMHSFDGSDGASPAGSLVQDQDGNLYGTTSSGGIYGGGVVFKLTPEGAVTVLHNFPDPGYLQDGSNPAGLVLATDGNFYGTTYWGGTTAGIIYQITPAGGYSILYYFDFVHGYRPGTTPIQHTNGKLYGITGDYGGGAYNSGVFYSLDIGAGPFIKLVSTFGRVGEIRNVLGQGFTGTTDVSFNGIPSVFTVVSDTYLTAVVPAGAVNGVVTVVTPTGTLTSDVPFQVIR